MELNRAPSPERVQHVSTSAPLQMDLLELHCAVSPLDAQSWCKPAAAVEEPQEQVPAGAGTDLRTVWRIERPSVNSSGVVFSVCSAAVEENG